MKTDSDRLYQTVEIGDVVCVIDNGEPVGLGMIVDFLHPFLDPIQIKTSNGMISRASYEIEKATPEEAVLWKLENL